jgi:hypothetical protein
MDFLKEEDFPQSNILQRGGNTAGAEERLLRWTAQQNEAPPADFYCSLEEGVPKRVAMVVLEFLQRGEFPREQTV